MQSANGANERRRTARANGAGRAAEGERWRTSGGGMSLARQVVWDGMVFQLSSHVNDASV
jgi:hypothetical protein